MNQHCISVFIKSFILLVLFLILGLPINNPYIFIFLLFAIPVIIFSKISQKKKLIYPSLLIIFLFLLFKFLFPSLNIQEGHNVVVLNKNSSFFYKQHLPEEVSDFFQKEFNKYYGKSECNERLNYCWKNFNPMENRFNSVATNEIFAFSSDWSFKRIKYSRIVNHIDFTNIKSARIGAINNLDYNFFWPEKFDLVRENIPFFVMYEIPKDLIGSSICWKGNLFWEQDNDQYLRKLNKNYDCTKISELDIDKIFFGVSMGPHENTKRLKKLYGSEIINLNSDVLTGENELILKLEKSKKIIFKEVLEKLVKILTILFIIKQFFKFEYKPYFISFLNTIVFLLIIYYVNKDLFNGFDIFTGGNDGLVYMSYGNVIFNNLLNVNFYEAFRGAESVFYFPSSLRFFWAINKILFGETFFGYLTIAYLYPIILFFIFKYLFGTKWSVFLTFTIVLTRLFEGYALSVITVIQHINQGDAEPLSIFLFLTGLLIFLKIINESIRYDSKFYYFLFGYLLFLSISLRPNFLPTALIFILALTFYNYHYHKNIKTSLFIGFGFLSILLIPLHNYYYGDSFVLFSSGAHHNTRAPISLYYSGFLDLINLDWIDSAPIFVINEQFNRWIQPQKIHYIVTFLIILILLIKKNNFIVKTMCLLALSQHFVLLIFEPDNRYAYLAWILTIILNFYFIINIVLKLKSINKIKKTMFR